MIFMWCVETVMIAKCNIECVSMWQFMWSIKFIYISILGQFDCLCVSLCFALHFSRYSSARSMTDGQKILVIILCCLLMSIPFTHFPCSALCTTNRRHFQVHINCALQLRLQFNKFMMHCSWTGNVKKSNNNRKTKTIRFVSMHHVWQTSVCGVGERRREMKWKIEERKSHRSML